MRYLCYNQNPEMPIFNVNGRNIVKTPEQNYFEIDDNQNIIANNIIVEKTTKNGTTGYRIV